MAVIARVELPDDLAQIIYAHGYTSCLDPKILYAVILIPEECMKNTCWGTTPTYNLVQIINAIYFDVPSSKSIQVYPLILRQADYFLEAIWEMAYIYGAKMM